MPRNAGVVPIGRYESAEIQRLCRDRPREAGAVARVAELQGGQIHREQLYALGIRDGAIRFRLRSGALHRTHRNVYGVGHRRDDLLAGWHAAVLTSGDGACLSHRAGAAHLGIRAADGGPIEITVPGQRRPREGIRTIRRSLPPDEVTVIDGLPVTTPCRTLFDLAGVLPERLFRRAVKEVEVQRLDDRLSLADLIRRHPRPPGAKAIKGVITSSAPAATVIPSDGEDRFMELVEGASLATPSHRYGIALADEWVEVDFAWPALRVAVEVDSSLHETQIALEVDRARDQALMADGWRVFRVTWHQLRYHPQRVLRSLLAVLAEAEADRSLRNR